MPSTGNLSCEGERDVSGLELSEKLWNARGEGMRKGRNQVMEELTGQGDEYILS